MTELPDAVHEEIKRLCAEGDQHAERRAYPGALTSYWAAWDLLPEPKTDWEAATWILVAIGGTRFRRLLVEISAGGVTVKKEDKRSDMRKDTGPRSTDIDLGYVDLNTASEQDLAQIPWIGPERARTLVERRPFTHMDDVRRLPGFTEDIMDELVRGGAIVGNPVPPKGG